MRKIFVLVLMVAFITGCSSDNGKNNKNKSNGPQFGENKCYTTIDCDIAHDSVYSLGKEISADNTIRLWLGFEKGIMFFEKDKFHKVETKGLFDDAGIVKDILVEPSGRIWFLCENKLIMKREEEWFPLRDGGGNRLISHNGEIYIASPGCLKKYVGGSFQRYNSDNSGLRGDLNSDSVNAVCYHNNSIWVGTSTGLAEFRPPATWNQFTGPKKMIVGEGIQIIPGNCGLSNSQIRALLSVGESLWIGTALGVTEYTAQRQWKVFHGDHMEVMDGRGNRSLVPGNSPMLGDTVNDICNVDNTLFFATEKGISMYDGRQWKTFSKKNTEFIGEEVNCVEVHDGWLYAGTSMGLLKIRVKEPEIKK